MEDSVINEKYDETLSEIKKIFLEKSKRYNYSFFKNTLLIAWLDVRRKYDRIDNLIQQSYCHGDIPDDVKKIIYEESEDLANYAIMFRVFMKLLTTDN